MRFWRETNRPEASLLNEAGGESVVETLRLAAERINEIVDAAERAASEISAANEDRLGGSDAEKTQITRERIAAELCDALVARANELRAEAHSLADVLSRASERLTRSTSPPSVPGPQSDVAGEPALPEGAETVAAPAPAPIPRDLTARVTERFRDLPHERGTPGGAFKRRDQAERIVKPGARRASKDGLRLLATQMAVAGSSREEIEDRLRSEFGVEEPSSVFGAKQGPGSTT